jgi:thiamine-phosphate pyrophosphorylase
MDVKQSNHGKTSGKELLNSLKGVMHSVKVFPKGVYGITSSSFGHTHPQSAKIFLDAGVKLIQYREEHKEKPASEMLKNAAEIDEMCKSYGAIFIVNDRVDIAVASKADGVHLGTEDMPIALAKEQFGGIIGASATNFAEAFKAQEAGADYLGVGAVFPTGTKADSKMVSPDEFKRIRSKISLPIYAIGGINYENVPEVKKLGADGIAVISAVLSAADPFMAAKSLVERWTSL